MSRMSWILLALSFRHSAPLWSRYALSKERFGLLDQQARNDENPPFLLVYLFTYLLFPFIICLAVCNNSCADLNVPSPTSPSI
jgi:hypothetical protein